MVLHKTDSPQERICVAVPVPVAGGFDYRWRGPGPAPLPGTRVRVPFGNRERIGIVIATPGTTTVAESALKDVIAVLDDQPLLHPELMATLCWAADYYHHPIGEVLAQALPDQLRRGKPVEATTATAWRLTAAGHEVDMATCRRRSPRQADALEQLRAAPRLHANELKQGNISADTIRRLANKGWIERTAASADAGCGPRPPRTTAAPPELSPDQHAAVEAIREGSGFDPALLFGVTGSGKTEVFLRLIDDVLARGSQCLLLVPEIGLTPQLVRRLRDRFGSRLAVFHSGLTSTERLQAWRLASTAEAALVVGTRSAAFAPLPNPGLIVVDEEHDPSYKQQSGFRYSGRDLAIMRAKARGIPIVLASATPSLESLRNALDGRYRLLTLPERIGAGGNPELRVVDLNRHASRRGLSTPLLAAMNHHLELGNQVLLFINRRGFAPALFCPSCEQTAECPRCDARMTVHASSSALRCHHCGRQESLHWTCPDCGSERIAVGAGTERVTNELAQLYPDHAIARLDRDVVSGRGALDKALAEVESGQARIIVGTALLTKGHDFPSVTLVGVLNADQGLFGTDFRSEERLAQTIIQVAGRAGRRERRGEVLIQTHYPNHPLLKHLLSGDYGGFAEHALAERRDTGWPPYSHVAVFRGEARERSRVFSFLQRLQGALQPLASGIRVLGPTPDWMERRDGRFRAQLLLQSSNRPQLQTCIQQAIDTLANWPETRRVRWSIDVDPVEL